MKKAHKLSEGRKMFYSVMIIFFTYAIIFILFEDYDRLYLQPFEEKSDWHLLIFSLVVMTGLAWLLHRYAKRMDERIHQEQKEKQTLMRRELTQNIAHELKTPVASILGYTETILNNPNISEETRNQFVARTHVQAQRLTALLQDISTLNRMDYAADMLPFERTDISMIVSEITLETEHALEEKRMIFKNELPEHIIVNGNSSMLYSIFRNLIDNAIHHAGEGTTVELTAEQEQDYWKFSFSDNGQGIPVENLPRIFERFYRIDKGRSRSMGGTGLGLAIVKNAVHLHGGTISAHPSNGNGVCVDFTLKI